MSGVLSFAKELNRQSNLPSKAFRRDAPIYALVSTMNNIIGCHLSGNDRPISVLKERALQFMEENPAAKETEIYYELAHDLLAEINT
ncbi:hypothetical protein KUV22_12715 [Microbulbifer agarilyticus]|uniref:hypothetical protein n=1 Tax=Microbulbifer agarilyticus TaxID=260552 RepID=UPI00111072EA|nr:hypothetical protein [Microbulbifer agarilyticus]MBY6191289.1 hypothetical protein [Microbulbifer agarilyticus]